MAKHRWTPGLVFLLLIGLNDPLLAQGGASSSWVVTGLLAISALLLLVAVFLVSENLIGLQASRLGKDHISTGEGLSTWKKWFVTKAPSFVDGPFHHLKKGHDIKLKGSAEPTITSLPFTTVALQPGNFIGMSPIPKVLPEPGDDVQAGDLIYFDKKRPEIKYAAPWSGEIAAINRGAKRSIAEVVILADRAPRYRVLPEVDLEVISRADLVEFLLNSGGWPHLRQRPYDIVPDPAVVPDRVFVSTFDTAPLAPDYSFVIQGNEDAFASGLKLLWRLTDGGVYLGLNANGKQAPADAFTTASGVEKHWFAGPHPAGNVGVQIHHIKPLSVKETVWVVHVQDVVILGRLITEHRYNAEKLVALTGQSLKEPKYVRAIPGCKIADLLTDQGLSGAERIISGDVLTGLSKYKDSYLNFYDDQITAIPEGNEYALFGWLLPSKMRPSLSRTFPGFLIKEYEYEVDTNTHGEPRAFVVTGQYEDLLPMDIYPQHLMKAIITRDYEGMEGLGIHELSGEDVALCEFACTSKQPLQKILREGHEMMREQG